MGYIEKNLMADEKVVYKTKLHKLAAFFWPITFLVLFIVSLAVSDKPELKEYSALYSVVGVCSFLGVLISIIPCFINYLTSEFGITNKRVLVKIGFIRRNSLEILLNKIEAIEVSQGILGRILKYGSMVIIGTGGTKNLFHKICDPLYFRKTAQEQIELKQTSGDKKV